MTTRQARNALCSAARLGARGVRAAAVLGAERVLKVPPVDAVPEGRAVDLPGRGRTFVVDVPGPTPDAPTIVLLHALGCTAYLSWAPSLGELSRTHRVIAFDQRWHGRGIRSRRFRLADCADDVIAVMDQLGVGRAIVAGYSMGGPIAQLTWKRHPHRVAGLVLCSTARNWRGKRREKLFFPVLTLGMHPVSAYAGSRVERFAQTLPEMPSVHEDARAWTKAEFRSTSAWSYPEVIGELGRFNSASWIGEVDVPTAVVITERDHTIPVSRQRKLADAIPGARVYCAPGGHASIFLDAARWVPVFVEAVGAVTARVRTEYGEVAV